MTKQTNGWQARAIHNAYNARAKRNKEIARLRAERVQGDEHTHRTRRARCAGEQAA